MSPSPTVRLIPFFSFSLHPRKIRVIYEPRVNFLEKQPLAMMHPSIRERAWPLPDVMWKSFGHLAGISRLGNHKASHGM